SAYFAMHRQAEAVLSRYSVTADQFVLLAALAEADALSQQDLTLRVGSDASTVRAMLMLLEGRGLVARGRHPSGGRARRGTLTPRGRRAFHEMHAGSEGFREHLLAAVGSEHAGLLLDILRRVTQAMATLNGRAIQGRDSSRSAVRERATRRSGARIDSSVTR